MKPAALNLYPGWRRPAGVALFTSVRRPQPGRQTGEEIGRKEAQEAQKWGGGHAARLVGQTTGLAVIYNF